MEVAQWLLEKGYFNLLTVVKTGSLKLLKQACSSGLKLTASAYTQAVRMMRLDLLTHLYQQKCPIDNEQVMLYAGPKGDPFFLRELVARGCTLTSDATCGAAHNGDLDFLKELLEKGIPVHPYAPFLAASKGHVHIIEHLLPLEGERKKFANTRAWVLMEDYSYVKISLDTTMYARAFAGRDYTLARWLLQYQ